MTAETFNKIVEEQIEQIRAVLQSKAAGYATEGDRLHNFKTCANEFGGTPEQALWGYLLKHLTSIRDLVNGVRQPTKEVVDEKIGDSINYLILLKGLFLERGV